MNGESATEHLLTREEFVDTARAALDELPDEIASQMSNVAVVVEEHSAQPGLLGLYEGVPLTRRGRYYDAPPDRITLFRATIEAICRTPEQVRAEVRKTVLHEVGHHFGMDERKLRELGYG